MTPADPNPLSYAPTPAPIFHIGVTVISAISVIVGGLVTLCCAAHTLYVMEVFEQHSHDVCNYWSQRISLGMPLEQSLPLGLFLAGCTLVAAIQLIRQINIARSRHS